MSYRVGCLCVGLFGFVPSLAAQSSEILLKAGDAIPAVGDLVFVDELEISDAKDWLVHAHARTPSFQFNEALFDGDPVLVREGMRLDSPPGASLHDFDSIDTNDSGDVALVARIRLPSTPGISEAVLWNRRVLVLEGDPLTAPLLPAGQVRVGQTIELAMDAGPVAGALARIDFASALLVPDSDCGIVTPAGDLLISPRHRVASLFPAPWDGTHPTSVVIPIPNDLALIDKVLFAQGAFRTPGTQTRSLTNALRIELGAP